MQKCACVHFMNTRIDHLIESAKLSRRNEVNLILPTGYGKRYPIKSDRLHVKRRR